MRQLFRIGEMAKLFGMNVCTLRYYDQLGLLCPIYTDPETNYRYYSTEQFERLNTIRYLRAQGVSLDHIKVQLHRRDPRQVLELLQWQQTQVAEQLKELMLVQARLKTRVERIEDAVRPDKLDMVRLETMCRRPIAILRGQIHTGDDLELPLRQLENSTGLGPNLFLGKVGLTAAREDLESGELGRYSALFCLLEAGDAAPEGGALPAGKWACLRFRGTHDGAKERYRVLLSWIETRGLTLRGDGAEFTLIDYGLTEDPGQFVTELQIPVHE